MPPRNETVRDRSNYFRRCCKNCAPPRPIPSPDFAILCPFPSANGTCTLSRGDVSLLLKPRSPRRYNGNVCAIFAFTTSQRRKIMKQQKKFSSHAMPARRPRKTQGKCVLFADAVKLYIGYSKAVTSADRRQADAFLRAVLQRRLSRARHRVHLPLRPARDRVRLRAARTRYVQNNTLLLDTMHTKWYAGPE